VNILRNGAQATLGLAQEEIACVNIGLNLAFAIQNSLQVDCPHGRGRIVAGQLQPAPRADLSLQSQQLKLIVLHLLGQPLPDEQIANSRRR
jgi:hypothetical protein